MFTEPSVLKDVKESIVTYIREYTHSAGFKKGIIGLSGGVDSSLSYFLTCEALGVKNTIGVLMPYRSSNEDSIKHAEKIIQMKNGIKRYYNITDIVDSFRSLLGNTSEIMLGNIMSRTRMIILYNVASEIGGLVVGTGNKTEILLGYFSVYGDGGCSMEPLGDLYKTEVWKLAEYLGIPKEIISKKPSADLWKGQTDESELGISYQLADSILYLLIEKNFTLEEIADKGYKNKDVKKIIELVKRSRFKRHTPPSPKLRNYNYSKLI